MAFLAPFRWFAGCVLLSLLVRVLPFAEAPMVAACSFFLLGPALFLLGAIDAVRRTNERAARGERRHAAEVIVTDSLRVLVLLLGLTALLIGGGICFWMLYVARLGGLVVLLGMLLGGMLLRNFPWPLQALVGGAQLLGVAIGRVREQDPFPPGEAEPDADDDDFEDDECEWGETG